MTSGDWITNQHYGPNPPNIPIKILDYQPVPLDRLGEGGGSWNVYDVTVEMPDGSQKEGAMEGDTHMWAFESFEEF